LFQAVVENIPDAVFLRDIDDVEVPGRIVYVNEATCQFHGYSRDEMIGQSLSTFLGPEVAKRSSNIRSKLLKKESISFESEHIRKDGSSFPLEVTLKLLACSKGRTVLAVTRTPSSEGKFRNLVERLNDVIFTLDSKGIITYISPVVEQYNGYTPEEIIGQTLDVFVLQEDITGLAVRIQQLVSMQSDPIEFRMKTKSGDWIWTRCSCRVVTDGEDVIEARGVLTDISDRRRVEEERIKLSKLESLGLLAGGIAHDFNNLLTGIIGHISIASLSVQKDDVIAEQIDAAEQAAMRAKDLTYQLLTFARGGAPVMQRTPLHDLLVESTTFAFHGSNIKCKFDIDEALNEANVDTGQISQVIQNLAINADQAMPEGGTFRVTAENVALGADDYMSPHINLPDGPYVKIVFSDEGCGIAPDHVTKVFDPYFTTKNDGSGLGLATTHSIIIQHAGAITVDSVLDKGTIFTVYLPAIPGLEISTPSELLPMPESEEGLLGGRVLVLDDEEMIRTLVKQILTRYGYDVVATADGVDTLSSYRQAKLDGSPFDVVVLDLTIPGGMGGKEVMQQLLISDPDVNAIVSSGYYNDPIMANYQAYGFSGIVAKPYKVQDLLETVQQTIQRPV
jgi:PAS domain S-box-containing protein